MLDSAINDDDDEEVNTTQPFKPGAASTPYQPPGAALDPYHGGEEHELSEFGLEQSGLAEKTPLLSQTDRERGLEYNHEPNPRCQCNRS